MSPEDLAYADTNTVLEKIAARIAKGASVGDRHSMKLLLQLFDEEERNEAHSNDTRSGGDGSGETPADSLSEGISEGNFENEADTDSEIVTDQEVDVTDLDISGNGSGNESALLEAEPPPVPPRPKRPTIMIAGEIVQQGD